MHEKGIAVAGSLQISLGASAYLNWVRSCAAIAVLFGHARTMFLVPFSDITHPTWFDKGLYFITGFGHQAVIVFFVLSGLLVSRSCWSSRTAREFWPRYILDRLTRLYVVIIPVLLLVIICDGIGSRLPGGSVFYREPIPNFNNVPFSQNMTAVAFIGNALFLQTIYVPTFGSDAPLWSLANEFWYYLLFPCLWLSVGGRGNRIAHIASSIAILWILPAHMLVGFLIWCGGAALQKVPQRVWLHNNSMGRGMAMLVSGVMFAGTLAWSRFAEGGIATEVMIGVTCMAWLYVVLHSPGMQGRPSYVAASVIAGFSFTLYVDHFPALVFVRTLLYGIPRWQPSFGALAITLCIVLFITTCSYMMSLVTEQKTHVVRCYIEGVLRRPNGWWKSSGRSKENRMETSE